MTLPSNAVCFLQRCCHTVISTVRVLLRSRRPSAIRLFIIAIVVDAIKASSFRPWSHIFQEFDKRFSPLCANRDTAPAVFAPPAIARIAAALNHAQPRLVGAAAVACLCAGLSVGSFGVNEKATAAFCFSVQKSSAVDVSGSSALAAAEPEHASFGSRWTLNATNRSKSAEAFSAQINQSHASFYFTSGCTDRVMLR